MRIVMILLVTIVGLLPFSSAVMADEGATQHPCATPEGATVFTHGSSFTCYVGYELHKLCPNNNLRSIQASGILTTFTCPDIGEAAECAARMAEFAATLGQCPEQKTKE